MMKIHLVNVSDVDESMRMQLRMWRNSDAVSPFFLLDQVTEDQQLATEGRRVFTGHGLANLVQAQSLSRSTLLRSGVHQTVVQLDVQVSHHSPSF